MDTTDISIADNITDNATPPVHAANGAATPSAISIDRSQLTCTRRQGEPCIVHIGMDLDLPVGVAVDDVFIGADERDLILERLYPELTFAFGDDGVVTLEGERQGRWINPDHDLGRDCEMDQHYDIIEVALSAVARSGACVVLTPRWLRGVTYRAERGWANVASLRELFNFWSVHLDLVPGLSHEVIGVGVERVIGDDEFGWQSSECSIAFSWISQEKAINAGLSSHALIACDVSFADDILERLLGAEESYEAHDAVNKSSDAMRRLLGVIARCADNNSRTTYVGGLVEPMTFFGLDR